ncbi:hypothetical protein NBRC116592_24920 [Colwellia sp. KU-HH00111]|uniref:GGDEF domain-containing protein n=1 Tax=Colwellia sp. KU-HH00111 TaxID=3127652 RepID=UPI003102E383
MTASKRLINPKKHQPKRLALLQKKRLYRAIIGFGIFFVGWLVVILSAVFDISDIKLINVFIGVAICLVTQVLLFYLLKTDKNLRFSDPNLTTVQLLNATFWITTAMILMPEIKGIMVFFSFICLLYSIYHTSKMALFLLPITSIIGLAIADFSYYLQYPNEFSLEYQAVEFAVFTLSAIWISIIANFSLKLRNKLSQQREEILTSNQLLALQNEQDPLTGLKNRRYFDEKFTIEYKRASRNRSSLSMVMMDLDNFKKINDTYGHDAGDVCLKFIASLLAEEVVRTGDVLARYGGEEFVILLPNTASTQAFQLALQLKDKINKSIFNYTNSINVELSLTASFGVSGYNENNVTSQDELLITADKALYQAKYLGRNQVQLYQSI